MKDVGSKPETRRSARASCVLHAPADCITRLREANTDKGDALKTARVAGILAAKRTDELIPLCHPLPLTSVKVAIEAGIRQGWDRDQAAQITARTPGIREQPSDFQEEFKSSWFLDNASPEVVKHARKLIYGGES